MQEVTVRIRFNRECLGSAKRNTRKGQTIFCLPRSPDGRNVMFLATWWSKILRYAATVANRSQSVVRRIDWDPIVDGSPRLDWKRIVVQASDDKRGRERYALHEAFPPGAVIGVNAVLPDGLSLDEFHELMEIAGTYKGISPFQQEDEKYGTFEIVSIKPSVRSARRRPEPEEDNKQQSTPVVEEGSCTSSSDERGR